MDSVSRPPRWPVFARLALIVMAWMAPLASAAGGNWPQYLGDADRGGACDERVEPGAGPLWVHDTGALPSPGFYPELRPNTLGPAKILAPTSTFDFAYAPIAAGGRVFFSSSTLEAVAALDARTGRRLWTFHAEGAVRFAPLYHAGWLYFGADDGCVYAVAADSGRLAWKYCVAPEYRRIIANGRLASQWPVRTSLAMDDGKLFFSAGLFPSAGGVFLCALKHDDGELIWKRNILTPSQGYLLLSGGVVLVPNGRASPAEYDLRDGAPLAPESDLRREGGAAFLCRVAGMAAYGPSEYGILRFRPVEEASHADPRASRSSIRGRLTGLMGWRVAVKNDTAYFLRWDRITALPLVELRRILKESAEQLGERIKDRKVVTYKSMVQQTPDAIAEREIDEAARWTAESPGGRALILTADHAFVGAEGEVLGFDLATGGLDHRLPVDGTAWELAAADQRLFASTSRGKLYAFGAGEPARAPADPPPAASQAEPDKNQDLAREVAAIALSKCGFRKGFCLVLGAGDGRLAAEIAAQSEMHVVCAEKDPATAQSARARLEAAGLYGSRVVVHVVEGERLPYLAYFANLVVSASLTDRGTVDFSPQEALGCLRPHGGALVLVGDADSRAISDFARAVPDLSRQKWQSRELGVYIRGRLDGAGDWSHMFADPANTSCSFDTLVGGIQYRLQWFGDPSPPRNVGWHGNGMGPLYKDGRLFAIKIDHVEAVDAYNGVSLWSIDVPGSTRLSPAREGGSACVDSEFLYFAVKNDCRVFDVATGRHVATYTTPDSQADWGYLAVSGDQLLGTQQRRGASNDDAELARRFPSRQMWNASEAEFVVSEKLFSLERTTGSMQWTYAPPRGGILNSSITADGQRIFLVQSQATAAAAHGEGSLRLREFFGESSRLVCVDQQRGTKVWERPWNPRARTMLYLSRVRDALVASYAYHVGPLADLVSNDATSVIVNSLEVARAEASAKLRETRIRFAFERLDLQTGATLWLSEYTSDAVLGAQHNYNNSHPVFAGDTIYHNPAEQYLVEVDLATGRLEEYPEIARGKGCATPTGSGRAIFYRSMGVASYDFASRQSCYVSDVSRPSCWMNVLPAGGLLLMPEYSMGCNCAFPLQTSIVLAPGAYPFTPQVMRQGQPVVQPRGPSAGQTLGRDAIGVRRGETGGEKPETLPPE